MARRTAVRPTGPAGLIVAMTPQEIAAVWNRLREDGGAVIRWDDERGEFRTSTYESYSVEDVHAVVRGLLAEKE